MQGRWTLGVIVGVALMATLFAWAAFRDIADRLESSPATESSPQPVEPQRFESAFTPGPSLGDLRDLLERDVALEEDEETGPPPGPGTNGATQPRRQGQTRIQQSQPNEPPQPPSDPGRRARERAEQARQDAREWEQRHREEMERRRNER